MPQAMAFFDEPPVHDIFNRRMLKFSCSAQKMPSIIALEQ